jgi:hypothetical protein
MADATQKLKAADRRVQAHPTKWTLVVWAKMRTGKPLTLVYDYDTQAEAETDLVKAQERGERAYVQGPVAAWGGQLEQAADRSPSWRRP